MTKNIILGLIVLLCSCSSRYKYWDISKFNMKPNALSDNEEIKLLYSSPAPNNNKDLDYYIQVIVVSQKSGDTVNILTTVENGFTLADSSKVFNYINPENPATKISQMDLDKLKDEKNLSEKINETQLKNITEVVRDPRFDDIADNKYPTVIGVIGIVTKNSNQ